MRRLEPCVPIDPAETLFSWLGRLAAIHGHCDMVKFTKDLQIPPRDIETGANESHVRLAAFTGVNTSVMARQHFFSVPHRRLRFRNEEFAVEFAPKPPRLVCPICLEEDGGINWSTGAQAWRFRLLWSVRCCPTCPKHGIGLVSTIVEKDRYVHLLDHARAIGERLPQLISLVTPRRLGPLQAWITRRLLEGRREGWLDNQDIDQAVKAAEMLGVVLVHGPHANMNLFGPVEWDAAWEAGYEVAAKGKAAIISELERLTLKGRHRGGRAQASLGRLYQWLAYNPASGYKAGPIREIVRDHILDNYPYETGEKLLGRIVASQRVHNPQSLSKATGIHPKTAGNLFIDMGCGESVMEASAAEGLAAALSIGIPLTKVPAYLNCSRVHARLLRDAGIIKPIGPPGRCDLHARFHPLELDTFLERLASRATRLQPPRDGADFAKCAMKAKLPSSQIVMAVLDGRLSDIGLTPGVRGYLGVCVSVAEVKQKLRA